MRIIGYFHICQKGDWERSFDMIFNYVKNYGLYDVTDEIRIGIVNDYNNIIENYRLIDSKFKIIFYGKSELYERPTLLHMKQNCTIDGEDVYYWYLHTKGLRHFNTERESYVIDWIKIMLYWNIRKWRLAIEKLQTYDIYGCNMFGTIFYSGNFWWAKSKHITYLPSYIEDYYTAPEDWILRKKDNYCVIYSSGIEGEGHYNMNFPECNYMSQDDLNRNLPLDFYIDTYKIYHFNINYNNDDYINDYFINGVHTNLSYHRSEIINNLVNKLPCNFNFDLYKKENNLINYSLEQIIVYYFINNNINTNNKILYNKLPNDFNYIEYRNIHHDLRDMSEIELINRWLEYGKKENRKYKIDTVYHDFDYIFYRNYYDDLKNFSDEQLINHWLNHGRYEGRIYKIG